MVRKSKEQFSGMWSVILGGSSGFGLAAVEKLARHGMNIAVLYRETAAAERSLKEKFSAIAATSEIAILPFNVNALDEAGRNSFVMQFSAAVGKKHCVRLLLHSIARGNLKPLVDSPGISEVAVEVASQESSQRMPKVSQEAGPEENYEILSMEDIQLTTYAMATSLLDWVRSVLGEGLFHPDARIIGLTSEGVHKYWEGYAAVSIAKASLESLMTYMAIELSKYGLKTNLIQAGISDTPSMKRIPASEKLIEMSIERNPLGRMTKPADVANVIYLLCTDEASWINGSVIHVDGGEHCL